MRGFGSDNHVGVHPQLLDSIINVNIDHAPSYGTDEWCKSSLILFQSYFGENAEVYFVFNGTGANVCAARSMIKPYEAIICSDISHIYNDECAAPELLTGGKLIPTLSKNGKLQISELEKIRFRSGDQHAVQIKGISITQPTEVGTVYSLSELKQLCDWAKSKNLMIHMDGARIANAVHFLGCTFKEMTTDIGIDVISFGGTKNGFMFGEAVVILNKDLNKNFKFIRKQSLQLPSKSRYIAAQFNTYLEKNLWREIAAHSHSMARLLEKYLKDVNCPEICITQPVESNAVFVKMPKVWIKELRKTHFFYIWDEVTFECRLMTSWDTTQEDILSFQENLKKLISAF